VTTSPAARPQPSRDDGVKPTTVPRTNRQFWMLRIAAVASLAAIWLICRYYQGIQHDARLYVGRALADLHPDTIGQEIAFAHDGQSGFSIFPIVMRLAIEALGPADAAMVITFLGIVIWVLAAAALLTRFMRGPLLWVSLVLLAAAPADYGGHSIFKIAESFATPRIYAEASGLLALAALLKGRKVAYFVLLGVTCLLHPIMALPIAAIGFAQLMVEDRRWIVIPLVGFLGLALAITLQIPVASRLVERFDPAWLEVVSKRSFALFPQKWLASNWAILVQQISLLSVLCRLCNHSLRTIAVVAVIATLIGLLLPLLFPTVLILQAQTWRAQWALAFLAPATLPLTLSLLYERGTGHRALIPLVMLMTIAPSNLSVTLFTVTIVHLCLFHPRKALRWPIVEKALWAVWSVATAAKAVIQLVANRLLFQDAPFVAEQSLHKFLILFVQDLAAPLLVILVIYRPGNRTRVPSTVLAFSSVVVAAWAFASWDARSSYTKRLEAGAGSESLRSILTSGSVLWLGHTSGSSWHWTHRPEWWSRPAGAGVVFDRSLAIEWDRRYKILHEYNLVAPIDRYHSKDRGQVLIISEKNVTPFCRHGAAPSWIVAPIGHVDGGVNPADHNWRHSYRWRAPAPDFVYNSKTSWVTVRDYKVIRCSSSSSIRF
jgi:hypothetical protein